MNRTTFLKSALLGICALVVASCSDTPLASDDSTSSDRSKGLSRLAANANPAIVFVVNSRHLNVIDADGSDLATIYTGAVNALLRNPTWAPTGAGTANSPWSVSFTEGIPGTAGSSASSYLKRLNVWVTSGRVNVSTPTTVVAYTSNPINVKLQAWSPSTTTGEIVFTEADWNNLPSPETTRLMVVPTSGGTPVELYAATDDYTAALGEFKPKQEVETELIREGVSMKVTVVMGSR